MKHEDNVSSIEIADYTGPVNSSGFHSLAEVQLDVQSYVLKPVREPDPRRQIKQPNEDEMPQMRILALPSATLNDAWSSLVFEDALPARLLRYLVRMIDMMSRPDLNLSTFNWNRLCLLHGPPGSGKSTLCRALAQKLSIRLGNSFSKATFVEISTNSLLSKYFGESGKHILSMFEHIATMCQDRKTLVCVVMDEVETIAGSRDRAANGSECTDGLRVSQCECRRVGLLTFSRLRTNY
jgi:Cdc6-like AAA superfamily ATPase